ncbi:MAG: phosphoribosylglycinamide formyltransferase [Pseudomonadota bacterium]
MVTSVAILISGRGSNMVALIEAAHRTEFPAEIALVLSDKPDAEGLSKAKQMGVTAEAINRSGFATRRDFETALDARLRTADIDLICLAGFMRLLSAEFVNEWRDKILNIHPSLLPSFKGLDTHRRAIEAGVRFSGCTVHIVRPAMDDGPIIAQAAVPVLPNDTEDSLADRILNAEHRLYPLALSLVADGKSLITGATYRLDTDDWAETVLFNPQPD